MRTIDDGSGTAVKLILSILIVPFDAPGLCMIEKEVMPDQPGCPAKERVPVVFGDTLPPWVDCIRQVRKIPSTSSEIKSNGTALVTLKMIGVLFVPAVK